MKKVTDEEPSKDDIIAFLKESLEIAELRSKLQYFNTEIAKGRAEELKALVFISQVTNPKSEDETMEDHVVTEQDMTNNPDLVDSGFNIGDTIKVPSRMKRKLKKETSPKE